MLEVEQEKLNRISSLSSNLVELKKRQSQLQVQKKKISEDKCSKLQKLRQEEMRGRTNEMDENEKELCRSTNRLVDEFINTCDDSAFNKTLVNVLGNMKGNSFLFFIVFFLADSKISIRWPRILDGLRGKFTFFLLAVRRRLNAFY